LADCGWIKLHRRIKDHWLWNEKRRFSKYEAWTDLLLSANHDPGQIIINGQIVKIERGQFITSEIKLADKWSWNRKTVRNFFTILENEKMLHKKSTTHWTMLTIDNYGLYQSEGTTERTTMGQQNGQPWDNRTDTNKNDKNDKKEKNKDIPCDEIKNEFNLICVSFPKVIQLSDSRKNKIRLRWEQLKTLEKFIELFTATENTPFLKGQNDRGWKASFDWLIDNDRNCLKVLERQYDKARAPNGRELVIE